MPAKVKLMFSHPAGEEHTVRPCRLIDWLREMDINPEEVIAIRDGRPIPVEESIKDGEQVEVIRVVSGG